MSETPNFSQMRSTESGTSPFRIHHQAAILYNSLLSETPMVEASESLLHRLCHEPTVFLADAYNMKLREVLKLYLMGCG